MKKRRKIDVSLIDLQRQRHQKAIVTIQRWWRRQLNKVISHPCLCDQYESNRLADYCILSVEEDDHSCSLSDGNTLHHVHSWGSLYYWCCQPVTRQMFTRFMRNEHVNHMLFFYAMSIHILRWM